MPAIVAFTTPDLLPRRQHPSGMDDMRRSDTARACLRRIGEEMLDSLVAEINALFAEPSPASLAAAVH